MRLRPARILPALAAAAWGLALAAPTVGAQGTAPPAAKPETPPGPKPAVIQAEELLDQNRPKEAVPLAEKAVKDGPGNPHGWFILARARHAAGDIDGAIEAGHMAANFAAVRASAFYNLACAYAAKGAKDDAFHALLGAKRAGFADRETMARDKDLASLHDDPRFVLPGERNFFTLKLADGSDLPFSVDLPVDFDPKRAYPCLVAPGAGKKVKDNWGGLFWGEDTSQRGWIAVESPLFVLKDPIGDARQLFDELARRYMIEGRKFHMAGYGPTSGPVFAIASAMPERIRSIWALPGFPATDDEQELAKLKGVKVCFIVGARDPIWYEETKLAYDRLQRLGVETYLEVVPDGGNLLQEMFGGEFAERLNLVR